MRLHLVWDIWAGIRFGGPEFLYLGTGVPHPTSPRVVSGHLFSGEVQECVAGWGRGGGVQPLAPRTLQSQVGVPAARGLLWLFFGWCLKWGGSLELGFLALLSPCLSDSAGKASGVTPQGTLLAPSG